MTRRSGAYGRARKALARKADQPRPEPADPLDLSPVAMRALHSVYLDSLMMQAPAVARALLARGGLAFGTFLGNIATSVLNLRATVDDEGEPAVALEVWDGEGHSTMAVIRGELLGLDADALGRAWSTQIDDELRGLTE